jgi:hypothetical protein
VHHSGDRPSSLEEIFVAHVGANPGTTV